MDDATIVKQKTDIISVISEHVNLKKSGRNYKGLCPFHTEKTPSFVVSPELQIFKCFGCGESGDVFSFLQKYEGMDFYEALTTLAKKAGVVLKGNFSNIKGERNYLFEINHLVAKFYHYILTKHPLGKYALDYLLKERGLSLSTITEFNLGYSPEQSNIFNNFFFLKKKLDPYDLEKLGIVYFRNRFPIDRFSGRIIFPLTDSRGNICGFSGRITPKDTNKDIAKYINTPETAIYHKSELLYGINISKKHIKIQKSAVVVEGELDMISCYQAGVRNVVAIKGSALTEEQCRVLSRLCSRVILALDSDFAGDVAARRGIKIFNEFGFEISVAEFGDYKDPDEVARSDREALFRGIDNAISIWDFLINSIFKRYTFKDGASKERISHEVVAVLSDIDDLIVRASYINLIAGKLGISPDVVEAQVQNYIRRKKTKLTSQLNFNIQDNNENYPKEEDIVKLWQERLFSLLIFYDLQKLISFYEEGVFSDIVLRKIIDFYKNQDNKNISYAELVEILPAELSEKARDLALLNISEDNEDLKKEIYELIKRIKKHNLELEKENVLSKIRQIETNEEIAEDKLLILQKRFKEIAQQITDLAREK